MKTFIVKIGIIASVFLIGVNQKAYAEQIYRPEWKNPTIN